jgi:hypothetical protein
MAITVTVEHRDGACQTFSVWPATEVEFERKFALSWTKAFTGDNTYNEHLYAIAHLASETSRPFEEWIKTIAAVTVGGGDDSNPTDPAPLLT